jgi:hypothetical protein
MLYSISIGAKSQRFCRRMASCLKFARYSFSCSSIHLTFEEKSMMQQNPAKIFIVFAAALITSGAASAQTVSADPAPISESLLTSQNHGRDQGPDMIRRSDFPGTE